MDIHALTSYGFSIQGLIETRCSQLGGGGAYIRQIISQKKTHFPSQLLVLNRIFAKPGLNVFFVT